MNEAEFSLVSFLSNQITEALSSTKLSSGQYIDIARWVARHESTKNKLGKHTAEEILADETFKSSLNKALAALRRANIVMRDGDTWRLTPYGQSSINSNFSAKETLERVLKDFTQLQEDDLRDHSEAHDSAPQAPKAPTERERIELSGELCARNTILYGPPGTGKTHATVQHSVALARHGRLATEADVRDQREFEQLRAAGRISFVTFHQSYAYEDFVEGLRPETVGGQIRYEVRPGTFRKIVGRALEALYAAPRVSGGVGSRPFEEVWRDSDEPLFDTPHIHNGYSVRRTQGKLEVRELSPSAGQAEEVTLDRSKVEQFYKLNAPRVSDQDYRESITPLFGPEVARRIPMALALWSALSPYAGGREVIDVSQVEHYVLVIDEINRGNMSRIFGELITLLEPSKRLGMEDALEVELPASGETFGVPPNLHILGTMNTADRSIALLDVALRRRFKFVELMPNAGLVGDAQARRVMEAINGRLELLLDREHQLGHALFMGARGAEDVLEVVRRDVLPLLKEYFYGDWERIAAVLGCSGATEEEGDALVYAIDVGARGLPMELLREEALRWRERLVVADAGAVLERIVEGEER